jgi:hypothetical protein
MSNSFTSPPTLADEVTVVAGQPIGEGAITAMSETANYLWAHGGSHNVVSQAWADGQFEQHGTTYQTMVEYVIPIISHDHYELHLHYIAAGPGGVRSTLTIGSNSDNVETLATGAGPHVIEQSLIITTTPTANYGVLSIEVKHTTGTPNHHEIRMMAARWVPKSSPVSTGALTDGTNTFTPFGINRVGNDYPLSSRWGVDMLENIETLRRRPIMYTTWSGVDNLAAAPTSYTDPAPALYLGVGDIEVLFSPVFIPFEVFENSAYTITVYLKAVNISATYPTLPLVIMGQEIEITANGWSSHTITVRPDSDEQMSQLFNFTVYRSGLDNDSTNWNNLVTGAVLLSPPLPTIQGVCIWGL